MRPTFVHVFTGLLLGVALAGLLNVPGHVVARQESIPPVRSVAAPKAAKDPVVHVSPRAERPVARPRIRTQTRVMVKRVFVPRVVRTPVPQPVAPRSVPEQPPQPPAAAPPPAPAPAPPPPPAPAPPAPKVVLGSEPSDDEARSKKPKKAKKAKKVKKEKRTKDDERWDDEDEDRDDDEDEDDRGRGKKKDGDGKHGGGDD